MCLALLAIGLSGCGTKGSSPCPAPAIVKYTPQFNQALAVQIEHICADPATAETCQALKDCYVLREKIRACGSE